MKSILVLFVVIVLNCNASSDVEKAFEENEIIPGSLPLKVSPKKFLNVVYPSGATVRLGNDLAPDDVGSVPKVTWNAEEGAKYTLLFIDLDAPSRKYPCIGAFRHWLVVNIPGNDVQKGEEVVTYRGSAPTMSSGYHRYVFLVFKQCNGTIEYNETFDSNAFEYRAKTSTPELVNKYRLGDPVFGNFYIAKNEFRND
ncbi:protein D2-like [Sitodiplosis mosellana]|uniref:protein D2-like n=1 Tax=Sitodiplosis mosellana TaxID=263140 RepID=UPI0024440380|nr:protein D2-like [Sitodiplosis mosellana]